MENDRNKEAVALERYKIISPIRSAIEENADSGKIGFLKSEACGLAGISRKTLNRRLDCYAQKGIDGLKYQSGSSVSKKKIPGELVNEAILLRREVPSLSIPQIIQILEMEGKAEKGFLRRATLQDRLREAGYSKTQMKMYSQPGIAAGRFARTNRNDMWQADIKHCGCIKYGKELKELYFVGIIDDATRYIIHGEFYHDFTQSIIEDSLRKGIAKHGLPRRLYFDNGTQFRNKWTERACAILDIKLIFTAPYSPEAKGKIERFNQTPDSFLAEAALKDPKSPSDYNDLFDPWLCECYHNKEHSSLNTTPEQAYSSSKTPKRNISAQTLAYAFSHHEKRKVDKSGCISFKGKKYEVGVIYAGRDLGIVYDTADISTLTVEDNNMGTSFRVRELTIGVHAGTRPKLPDFMAEVKPDTSRLLDEVQKRHDKHQLSATRAISYSQINKAPGEQGRKRSEAFLTEGQKFRKNGGEGDV